MQNRVNTLPIDHQVEDAQVARHQVDHQAFRDQHLTQDLPQITKVHTLIIEVREAILQQEVTIKAGATINHDKVLHVLLTADHHHQAEAILHHEVAAEAHLHVHQVAVHHEAATLLPQNHHQVVVREVAALGQRALHHHVLLADIEDKETIFLQITNSIA